MSDMTIFQVVWEILGYLVVSGYPGLGRSSIKPGNDALFITLHVFYLNKVRLYDGKLCG